MIVPLMMIALQAATVVSVATPVKPVKPKLICELVERMGSRIQADQVCITKEEWLKRRQDDRERLDRTKINSPSTAG